MPVRDTSAIAYQQIKDEGLLSAKRFEIYDILYSRGPLTASQIQRHMSGSEGANKTNAHARLFEMRDMGCVQEMGKVVCPVTGMTVICWDVTAGIPVPLEKGLTNMQRVVLYKRMLNGVLARTNVPEVVKRELIEEGKECGVIK